MKPLNGENSHPLSAHAIAELKDIAVAPVPRCGVNPGVANRLLREALVESAPKRSPFKTHKGGNIEHLVLTQAGMDRLYEIALDEQVHAHIKRGKADA